MMMSALSVSAQRRISTLLVTVGLFAALFGYVGAIVRTIVLDPQPSIDAATIAVDDPKLHDDLAREINDAVIEQLIGTTTADGLRNFGVDVRADLAPIAEDLLDTPEFLTAYQRGVTAVHNRLFLDPTGATTIELTALADRARADAIAINPLYEMVFPDSGQLSIRIGSSSLPNLTWINRLFSPLRVAIALGGLALVALGIVISPTKKHPLRLAGGAMLTLGACQLVACVVAGWLIDTAVNDTAIAEAATTTVLPYLTRPALAPTAMGIALILAAYRVAKFDDNQTNADGRSAFLTDGNGHPVAWASNAAYEPEVLRTAPANATYQR